MKSFRFVYFALFALYISCISPAWGVLDLKLRMRRGREDRGSSEIDVRAAHARVVCPPLREAVDDSSMIGGGRRNVPDTLDAASPSITHVPNNKLPHPLGSPPWTAGRSAPLLCRRIPKERIGRRCACRYLCLNGRRGGFGALCLT